MIEKAKTDWKYEDVINYTDFQRIYRTQLYVADRTAERLGISEFELIKSGLDSYEALGYASEINKIEENLRRLITEAGQLPIGYIVESWPQEERNPDFTDATRWEDTTQRVKVTVYYTSIFLIRCGAGGQCGQKRFWQVRFRNLAGLMWKEFEDYEMDWEYKDELDMSWTQCDYQPL